MFRFSRRLRFETLISLIKLSVTLSVIRELGKLVSETSKLALHVNVETDFGIFTTDVISPFEKVIV